VGRQVGGSVVGCNRFALVLALGGCLRFLLFFFLGLDLLSALGFLAKK